MTPTPEVPLDVERWRRLADLVEALVELEPEYRSSYLAVLGSRNPGLRDEALRVLALFDPSADVPAAGEESTTAVDGPAIEEAAGSTIGAGLVGRRLGPYRVIDRLGAGGMGEVYLAERDDEEYRRQVAIKVLRGGMEQPWTHRRFRRERQILASLVHPNIARMYDAGTTADGLPYLVMERVDGEPITEYCRSRSLAVEERLELFLQVCSAVDDAHRRLVLHRDLKPSNILVTTDGEPKLLDFGVARLLDPDAEDATATLGPSGLTLAYASPEQILGEATDTSSDVYSLGVVLYELLTGRNPHRRAAEGSEESPVTPWHRLRGTQKPPLPASTTLAGATKDEHGWDAAARERSRRLVRGDLDNIVAKALRFEPERRYASVDRLVDDLRRFLEGRPVGATSDAWSYRLGKLVRRHRLPVAALAVTFVSLVVFAVVSARQAKVVAEERDRAETALERVTLERDRNEQISDYLLGLFDIVDRDSAAGRSLTAKELIDGAVSRIQFLDADPAARARLYGASSQVYFNLGQVDEAVRLANRAIEVAEEEFGPNHRATLEALVAQARVFVEIGRLDDANAVYETVLARADGTLPEDDPLLLPPLVDLAGLRLSASEWDEAEALARRARRITSTRPDIDFHWRYEALRRIAEAAEGRGDLARAEAFQSRVPSLVEREPEPLRYAHSRALLRYAEYLFRNDRGGEAVPSLRRALEIIRAARDYPIHAEGVMLRRLGEALFEAGEPDAAIGVLEEAEAFLARASAQAPHLARARLSWMLTLETKARIQEAAGLDDRATWTRILELARPLVENPAQVHAVQLEAKALIELGREAEARERVKELRATGWDSRRLRELEAELGLPVPEDAPILW